MNPVRFRLRTLLIVLVLGPPAIAIGAWAARPKLLHAWREYRRELPPGVVDDGGEIYYYQPDERWPWEQSEPRRDFRTR